MSDQSFCRSTEEVECLPLKTLEEVLMWVPKNVKYEVEPLWERTYMKDVPRTLVCHDMKGGYLEDRFIHGIRKEDCYIFIHWSIVDIFVYFSHHFVTIPPCGWITAAHRNGTKILGTVITEWDVGAKICENFLNNKESVHHFCTQLTNIANFFGFDGWLINIENKIQAHHIKQLEEFVSVLSQKMHAAKPDSLVIWYDSVIQTGTLKWQNSLNHYNRNFFSACDGIFLNYAWKDEHLRTSVAEAGLRVVDVYVGIDVFGRGCFGGGGFCTNVAVRAARDYGLSVAIFAPGWVYEFLGKDNFLENQYRFWDMLAELCPPHNVKRLPFTTSFCPGFGKKMHRRGKVISSEPWFDLSLQQPQPTYHYMQSAPLGGSITVFLDDVYNGGGCLEFKGRQKHDNKIQNFGLLSTFFELEKTFIITYTFKPIFPCSVDFSLLLSMSSSENLYNLHLLGKNADNESESSEFANDRLLNVLAGAPSLEKLKYPATLSELEAIACKNFNFPSVESGWITRVYIMPASEFRKHVIKSIDGRITYQCEEANSHFSVLLGQLQFLPLEDKIHLYYTDLQHQIKGNKLSLWCRLEWTQSTISTVQKWDIFYKYCGKQNYLWTTSQCFFKVDKLELDHQSDEKSEIEFVLSAQNIHGQPVESESLTICL